MKWRWRDRDMKHLRRNLLGWFCAILIAVGVTFQATHAHSDGAVHSDCVFCHVVHLTVQHSAPQISPFVARPIAEIAVAPQAGCARRFLAFSLWNRPPPLLRCSPSAQRKARCLSDAYLSLASWIVSGYPPVI